MFQFKTLGSLFTILFVFNLEATAGTETGDRDPETTKAIAVAPGTETSGDGSWLTPRQVTHRVLVANGYDPATINLDAPPSSPEQVTDEIVLSDGDVIRGRITEESEEAVVLEHPVFEEMRIPRDRIVAIRRGNSRRSGPGFGELVTGAGVRPPSSFPRSPATQVRSGASTDDPDGEQDEASEKQDTIESLTEPDTWTFVLGTAFGYVQNVNSEINLRLSAQAEHTSDFARLRIDSAYFLNSTNDTIVDNDLQLSSVQDWYFPSLEWSIFASAAYQWDAFEEWEHRLSGYLGPGYKLVEREDLAIDLRVGAGATYEYGLSQTLPEALLSFEWSWEIDDRQRLNGVCSYLPDLTRIDQYRLQLNGEWNFRLQKEEGLSFYVGVKDEYQSMVSEGSTNNDLRLFGGIKYEF